MSSVSFDLIEMKRDAAHPPALVGLVPYVRIACDGIVCSQIHTALPGETEAKRDISLVRTMLEFCTKRL